MIARSPETLASALMFACPNQRSGYLNRVDALMKEVKSANEAAMKTAVTTAQTSVSTYAGDHIEKASKARLWHGLTRISRP